jgi:hypothetical protein
MRIVNEELNDPDIKNSQQYSLISGWTDEAAAAGVAFNRFSDLYKPQRLENGIDGDGISDFNFVDDATAARDFDVSVWRDTNSASRNPEYEVSTLRTMSSLLAARKISLSSPSSSKSPLSDFSASDMV